MPQTIKVKLDERKVILAQNGNINREEVNIKVNEQDLEIPDDLEYGRILTDRVEVNCKREGDIDFDQEEWRVSIHKGFFYKNAVLDGNERAKGIIGNKPVIGSFGYRFGGILTVGVLAVIAIGFIWGLIKGKIRMPFKKVQPKTDINNPLNNWGIANKQS